MTPQVNAPKFVSLGAANINERAISIHVKSDGSYFVGGLKNDSALIVYMSSLDAVIWAKTFKFSPSACYVNFLSMSSDGYLIGAAISINGSNYLGSYFKIDPANGNFIWNHAIVGNSKYFSNIIEKNLLEYICVGSEYPSVVPTTGADIKNMTVSALTGTIISQSNCVGLLNANWLDDLAATTPIQNGFFYSTGRSYVANTSGQMRAHLFKYDNFGNIIWSKYLHKSITGVARMYPFDIIYYSPTQLLLLYGSDETCTGGCVDYASGLMLIDTSGTVIWDKVYNIPASNGDFPEKVNIMGNSIYISGFTNVSGGLGNVFILKTDLSGNLQNARQFGSPTLSEKGYLPSQSNGGDLKNGLFYFAYSAENPNNLLSDINILKVDSTLNLPCYPSTSLAVNVVTVAPYQTVFPRQVTLNTLSTSINPSANSTIFNPCPNNITRLVDTINVLGNDTIISVFTSTATSYNWNTGANTATLYINSSQIDSVLISSACCAVVKRVFYFNLCSITLTVSGVVPICAGQTNTLTVLGGVTHTWNPGGVISNSIVISPNATSIFTVLGTAPTGCVKSLAFSQVVYPNPIPIISPGNPSVCIGNTLILTASGATSYTWLPGNSNSQILPVSPLANTGYTLLGRTGACSGATSVIVTAIPMPTLTVSGTSSVCLGQQLLLIGNGASTYTWFPGNISGPTFLAYPLATTVYTVTGENGICLATTTVQIIVNSPTLTIAASPATICIGETTSLTVSGGISYTWMPGAITGSMATFSPTISTIYSVTGINEYCYSTVSSTITVNPLPEILISQSTSSVCAGTDVYLNAYGATSYSWLPGNQTVPSIFLSPTASSVFSVAGSLLGCIGQATYNLFVFPIPTLNVSGSNIICSGTIASFSITGASSYKWSPGNSTGNIFNVSPTLNSNYTVMGTTGPCSSTAAIFVQVVQNPSPTIIPRSLKICEGATETLKASGAQTFSWLPSSVFTSINGSSSQITAFSNTIITLQGANSLGTVVCVAEYNYPVAVMPYLTPSVSPNTSICRGDNVTLFAQGASSYAWSPLGGIIRTDKFTAVVSPYAATVYSVRATDENFCSRTATVLVNVNLPPKISVMQDTVFKREDHIFIRAKSVYPIRWISGENILCPDCPLSEITVEYPIKDVCFTAEVINEFGCKARDEVCLKIDDEYAVYIPNTFTPDNDGVNEVFYVYGYGITDYKMEIYDRWGEKLFESNDRLNGWNGTYRGKNCAVGTYAYVVDFKVTGKKYSKTGHVSILR